MRCEPPLRLAFYSSSGGRLDFSPFSEGSHLERVGAGGAGDSGAAGDQPADGGSFGERLELRQAERGARRAEHAFEEPSVHRADQFPVLVQQVAERAVAE
jgi:hypothetical protein